MTDMHIYRNKWYISTARVYDCTTVVACYAEIKPNDNWVQDDNYPIDNLDPLYTEDGVRYFGYL